MAPRPDQHAITPPPSPDAVRQALWEVADGRHISERYVRPVYELARRVQVVLGARLAGPEREQAGYVPDFDLDAAVGRQGVLFVTDIIRGLSDGSVEVKRDERARQTGRIYVESDCAGLDGRWYASGIRSSRAETWAYVVPLADARELLLAVPRLKLLEACQLPWVRTAEQSRGSNPTRGIVLSLPWLVQWLLRDGR